ncbi:MAG: hypothetical protein K2K76_01800, partial [Muribaculaceae bacterium]|nr:hypothetical protein [Muribaculaceae bacterium]
MKLKNIILPVGSLLLCGTMTAQRVDISPVPQQIEWGKKAFDRPGAFNITGAEAADPQAVAMLKSEFPQG